MANYPLPAFHFILEWGGSRIGFTEVSGLTVETQAIDYRDGASPVYSVLKTKVQPASVRQCIFTALKSQHQNAETRHHESGEEEVHQAGDRRGLRRGNHTPFSDRPGVQRRRCDLITRQRPLRCHETEYGSH